MARKSLDREQKNALSIRYFPQKNRLFISDKIISLTDISKIDIKENTAMNIAVYRNRKLVSLDEL
jgi:hypothetical protein